MGTTSVLVVLPARHIQHHLAQFHRVNLESDLRHLLHESLVTEDFEEEGKGLRHAIAAAARFVPARVSNLALALIKSPKVHHEVGGAVAKDGANVFYRHPLLDHLEEKIQEGDEYAIHESLYRALQPSR